MQKLELTLGIHNCILALINDILENNYIRVINGLMLSDTTTQTNGVLQGDPLSPLVSNLLMADVKRTVSFQNVTLLMYADYMALLSSNHEEPQAAFDSVNAWATENSTTKRNQNKSQNSGSEGSQRGTTTSPVGRREWKLLHGSSTWE
jgi:hypothetical protein